MTVLDVAKAEAQRLATVVQLDPTVDPGVVEIRWGGVRPDVRVHPNAERFALAQAAQADHTCRADYRRDRLEPDRLDVGSDVRGGGAA